MEYLKRYFEGVGSVFSLKRNDSESIAEARANVKEISYVYRNSENHEGANALMTSVVEAVEENGRLQGTAFNSKFSTGQQKQNEGSSINANQTDTEWRNSEETLPNDAKELSQSLEQNDSPEIARDIMRQDSFVTETTECRKVSECFTLTKPGEIEKEIESKASEENLQSSTMAATLAHELGHGRKLEWAEDRGDGIESLIIPSNKARRVSRLKQDVQGKDVKDLFDEAAIELMYSGPNFCIQSEKEELENFKEGKVVALTRDEKNNKAAEILMHSQLNDLLKQNSTNMSTVRKGHERDEKVDASEAEERVFCDDATKASLSKTSLPKHGYEAGIMPLTVNASSTVKFETKFISNSIKEVKEYSPLLLARLKQINKNLRELRVQLLQVQKIGQDEAKETKLEDDIVALY